MSRLIDANEVVKAILEERDKIPRTITTAPYELGAEKPYHAGDQMRGGIRKALRCIEQAPTVDAVPVVRCSNCIHWVTDDLGNHVCSVFDIANSYGEPVMTKPDDFCSYGERKEGAD